MFLALKKFWQIVKTISKISMRMNLLEDRNKNRRGKLGSKKARIISLTLSTLLLPRISPVGFTQLTLTRIQIDDNNIIIYSLLTTATQPKAFSSTLSKSKSKDHGFKVADDGRLVIKDDDSDSDTGKKPKKLPFLGSDSEDASGKNFIFFHKY